MSAMDKPPVLRSDPLLGEVYCSPWCGFKCRKAAFDQATAEADALAARMGEGWKPRVWENCGWHYQVAKGNTKITVHTVGSSITGGWTVTGYLAWIEPSAPGGEGVATQFIESGVTPEDALGHAKQRARTFISHLSEELASILD